MLKRFMSKLLFQVTAGDPLVFVAAAALLGLAALIAAGLAVHRATRVSPIEALRYD
jgi:ABC-type antimicrobial peptide transport system permease subunit